MVSKSLVLHGACSVAGGSNTRFQRPLVYYTGTAKGSTVNMCHRDSYHMNGLARLYQLHTYRIPVPGIIDNSLIRAESLYRHVSLSPLAESQLMQYMCRWRCVFCALSPTCSLAFACHAVAIQCSRQKRSSYRISCSTCSLVCRCAASGCTWWSGVSD